jgi:hypothetical protein
MSANRRRVLVRWLRLTAKVATDRDSIGRSREVLQRRPSDRPRSHPPPPRRADALPSRRRPHQPARDRRPARTRGRSRPRVQRGACDLLANGCDGSPFTPTSTAPNYAQLSTTRGSASDTELATKEDEMKINLRQITCRSLASVALIGVTSAGAPAASHGLASHPGSDYVEFVFSDLPTLTTGNNPRGVAIEQAHHPHAGARLGAQ